MNSPWIQELFFGQDSLLDSTRWLRASNAVALLGIALAALAAWRHGLSARRAAPAARNGFAGLAMLALAGCFALTFTSVWMRGVEVNHFPSQTMSEVLVMFTLALLASMLVLHYALGLRRVGPGWAIVDDALILLVLLGSYAVRVHVSTLSTAQRDLPPALQSYWFPPHLSALIFSYATLGIAGLIALVYFAIRFWSRVWDDGPGSGGRRALGGLAVLAPAALAAAASRSAGAFLGTLLVLVALAVAAWLALRGRGAGGRELASQIVLLAGLTLLPFGQFVTAAVLLLVGLVFLGLRVAGALPRAAALASWERTMDEVSYRAFSVGFPFLTAGLFMGAFWAQEAWANYWGWDSKENSALITWLVYVVYIHLRWLGGYRGGKAMAVLVGGALSVFLTFQVFGYLPDSQKSLHRYTDDDVRPSEGQQGAAPDDVASAAGSADGAEASATR